MASRSSSTRSRSKREWGVRIVLAVAAGLVGWLSVSDTLANVAVKADAHTAFEMAPWDGVIAAKVAQADMSVAPVSDDKSDIAAIAREALSLDPTVVDALAVLGLQAQLRGDTEKARDVFAHSLALSRRELRPQLWAIEEAVSRGDVVGALRQYDIALRTSRRAPDILFPVLASAIAEPKVRAALISMMRTDPVWSTRFIAYVGRGQIDPIAAVAFFQEGQAVGIPIDDANRTSLVNALFSQERTEEAWDYYSSFRRVEKDRSRDPDFSASIQKPAVFDWTPRSSSGMSASLQPARDGGVVEFSAAPSAGGIVLEQRQALSSGDYVFDGLIEGVEQPERSRPYWVLKCSSGRELGRIPIPNSNGARANVVGRFTVPSDCVTQTLSLVVRPSDEIGGVFGRALKARLLPASSDQ